MTNGEPTTSETDADVQARKRTLVDALYRKYRRALTRFLTRQRVGSEEAADIIQETYCRIHQVEDVESIRFPQAFLFRTATNLVRNRRKAHARAHVEVAVEAQEADEDFDELTPYRVLNGQQELAVVRRSLKSLSPKCRRVFVMNRFEEVSYPKIAEELGISVSMVEKYISQALAHLKADVNGLKISRQTMRLIK